MPAAGGPNTLGESNLVFAYDTGDTGNSYKGQPTVNAEAANIDTTFESNIISDTAGFNNQLGSGNYLGVSSNMGYRSSKSLRINRGTGGTGRIYKTYSVLTGQYSSVSCWVYSTTAGPFLALEYNGGDYSWGVGYTNNTHTGKGWELLYVRTTGPATSNTTGYYFLYPSIENQDIYLDNIQVELKQYPTTFVNGTRSVTQGLLDLTGNSTVDLSNVSFDSSAKMVFDGTNDYVNVPYNTSHNLTSQGTISAWINPATLTQGSYAGIVAQCTGGSGNAQAYQLSWRQVSNGIYGAICNGLGTYNEVLAAFPSTANVWYNIVFTWNQAQLVLYINGVAYSTTTQTINNQVLATDLTIGGFTYKGAGGSGEAFNGKIDKVELYNRGLTALEVRQNYQQNKTRFNIS